MSIRKWPDEEPFTAISSWLKFLAHSTLERSGKKCLEVVACFSSQLEHTPSFIPHIHITHSSHPPSQHSNNFLSEGPSLANFNKRTLLLLTLYHPYLIIFVFAALITTRYIIFFFYFVSSLPKCIYSKDFFYSTHCCIPSI